MEERFEVYKREVVARFYEDHFRHYARQIVLVDVLRALLAGRDAFEDTRLALEAILESFRYGHGGIISKLLFGSAYRQGAVRRHQGRSRARHPARPPRGAAAQHGGVPGARRQEQQRAIRRDGARLGDLDRGGHPGDRRPARAGRGRPAGRQRRSSRSSSSAMCRSGRRARTPGARRSSTCRCSSRPPIDPSPVEGIPHINLDLALEFLLGDRLR